MTAERSLLSTEDSADGTRGFHALRRLLYSSSAASGLSQPPHKRLTLAEVVATKIRVKMAKTTGKECYRTLDEEAKELEVDVGRTDAWAVSGWPLNSDLLETVEQLQTDEVEVADKTQ